LFYRPLLRCTVQAAFFCNPEILSRRIGPVPIDQLERWIWWNFPLPRFGVSCIFRAATLHCCEVACDRASVEILPSAPVTSGDAAELGAASGAAAEGAAPVPIKRKRGRQRKLVVDNAENAADASSQEPAQSKGSQESRPGICTSPPPGASVWDDPEFLLFGFWVAGESSNLPDCSRLNLECGKRRRQHAYA